VDSQIQKLILNRNSPEGLIREEKFLSGIVLMKTI